MSDRVTESPTKLCLFLQGSTHVLLCVCKDRLLPHGVLIHRLIEKEDVEAEEPDKNGVECRYGPIKTRTQSPGSGANLLSGMKDTAQRNAREFYTVNVCQLSTCLSTTLPVLPVYCLSTIYLSTYYQHVYPLPTRLSVLPYCITADVGSSKNIMTSLEHCSYDKYKI